MTEEEVLAKYQTEKKDLRDATFKDMFDVYPIIAKEYEAKTGKNAQERRLNVANTSRRVLEILELPFTIKYKQFNDKMAYEFVKRCRESGKYSGFTIVSYLENLRALGAKWTHACYEDHGLRVESIKLPTTVMLKPPYRYKTRTDDEKKHVKELYANLEKEDPCVWFFMTMMLCFAMRNNDVKRLTWANFVPTQKGVYLQYTPHKTRLTSARTVNWPIPGVIWNKIEAYKAGHPKAPFEPNLKNGFKRDEQGRLNSAHRVERRLRKYMKELGFSGSKNAYELRKLCADAIYSNFGQEMASSITGDDIRTVTKFYADPSSLSKEVDVTTLI